MTKATFCFAHHFCGSTIYKVEDPGESYVPGANLLAIDSALPYKELHAACLMAMAIRWSSTGGVPNHLGSMSLEGRVAYFKNGRIVVSGRGWMVSFEPPDLAAETGRLLGLKDYATLSDGMTALEIHLIDEPDNETEVKARRWRK